MCASLLLLKQICLFLLVIKIIQDLLHIDCPYITSVRAQMLYEEVFFFCIQFNFRSFSNILKRYVFFAYNVQATCIAS